MPPVLLDMMRITPVQHEQARVEGDRRAWQGKLLNDSRHSGGVCCVHKIGASPDFAGSAASPFEHASHSVRRAGACTLPVSAAGDHSPGKDFASSIEKDLTTSGNFSDPDDLIYVNPYPPLTVCALTIDVRERVCIVRTTVDRTSAVDTET